MQFGKVYRGLWQGSSVAIKLMHLPVSGSGNERVSLVLAFTPSCYNVLNLSNCLPLDWDFAEGAHGYHGGCYQHCIVSSQHSAGGCCAFVIALRLCICANCFQMSEACVCG
jgi:hypothetical protein